MEIKTISRNRRFYLDCLKTFSYLGIDKGEEYIMLELYPLYNQSTGRVKEALKTIKWCKEKVMSQDLARNEYLDYDDETYDEMMTILKQYVIDFYNMYISEELKIPEKTDVFQYLLRNLLYEIEDKIYLRHLKVDRSDRPNYLYITYLNTRMSKSASVNIKDPDIDFISFIESYYITPLSNLITEDEEIKKILKSNDANIRINPHFYNIFYKGAGISPLRLDAYNRAKLNTDKKQSIINFLSNSENFRYSTSIEKEHYGCVSYKGEFKVDILDDSIKIDPKTKIVFEKNLGISRDWVNATISPRMLLFFNEFCNFDQELLTYLRQYIKMCIYGKAHILQKWVIFLGDGNNGKTVMVSIIGALLGDFYKQILPNNLEIAMKGTQTNTSNTFIAQLEGARFVMCEELSDVAVLNTNLIKMITGDGEIVIKDLYKSASKIKTTFGFATNCNNLPSDLGEFFGSVSGSRRMAIFPSEYTVPADKLDPELKNKLTTVEELNGLANWVINNGLPYDKVLPLPSSMSVRNKQVTQEQIETSTDNNFLIWTKEFIPTEPFNSIDDFFNKTKSEDVYKEFSKWYKMDIKEFVKNMALIGRKKARRVVETYIFNQDTNSYEKDKTTNLYKTKKEQINIYELQK